MSFEQENTLSQPRRDHPVFNRWDVLPRAWYFVMPSAELPKGSVKPLLIGKQRLVVFRGASGKAQVLDGYCPHMGTDLAIGKVVGDNLRCFFHHWEFGRNGACQKIPCQETIPSQAVLNAYATEEKFGSIWVFPDKIPDIPLIEIPGLEGADVEVRFDGQNLSKSHHHISMINGLDAQHLNTIHGLSINMTLDMKSDERWVDFVLEGPTPTNNLVERLFRVILGPRYSYAMRYAQASVAALTLMKNVYFIKPKWRWPELYMLYAYRPLPDNTGATFPIYVARKRKGLFGPLVTQLLLAMTRTAYMFLKDDDDQIYNNIRFNTKLFLPMDKAVVAYINYVDHLKPSIWSQHAGQS